MFEEYYATFETTENLSEDELDRFNLYLEEHLTSMDLDPVTDLDRVESEAQRLADMYLGDDPETWPF
jgi:hypothetical protein